MMLDMEDTHIYKDHSDLSIVILSNSVPTQIRLPSIRVFSPRNRTIYRYSIIIHASSLKDEASYVGIID